MTFKKLTLTPNRVTELKREKKSYSFWEIETPMGTIDINNQLGTIREKEAQREMEIDFFEELQRSFFRK